MWFMSIHQSSTSYTVIGLLVAALAIVGLLAYLRKRTTKKTVLLNKVAQAGQGDREIARPASTKVTDTGFSVQLFVHLKSFAGSLNSLEDIANKDFDASFAQITFDNIEQIIRFYGAENDKNRFIHDRKGWGEALYKDKARELLVVIKSYGVSPVKEDEVVWDKALLTRYMRITSVNEGQTCEVVAPYWTFSGEIFEKGVVRPKEV